MALFSSLNSNHSVAVYKLQHYPWSMISTKLREAIQFESDILIERKAHILQLCNSDLTHLEMFPGHGNLEIKWLFNNIPSEAEWNARGDDSFIYCTIRRFCEHGLKPVVILSFGTTHATAAKAANF